MQNRQGERRRRTATSCAGPEIEGGKEGARRGRGQEEDKTRRERERELCVTPLSLKELNIGMRKTCEVGSIRRAFPPCLFTLFLGPYSPP